MSWGPIPIAPQSPLQPPQIALAGFNSATSKPVQMVSAGSAHTKGAWLELFSSTGFNATMLELMVQTTGSTGANRHMLCDIGIGPSGSETVLVPNMAIGSTNGYRRYTLPIWVPQGTRIVVRYQTAQLSVAMSVQMIIHNTGHAQADTGATAAVYGANTATSSGTALTIPAAVNTTGAWTQLTASTATALRGLLVMPEGPAGNVWSVATDALFDIGYGTSGAETLLLAGMAMSWSVGEMTDTAPLTLPVNIPSSTRLVARYQASDITQAPLMTLIGIS